MVEALLSILKKNQITCLISLNQYCFLTLPRASGSNPGTLLTSNL